jgi:O-antigen/teichoic acid export membrane protein
MAKAAPRDVGLQSGLANGVPSASSMASRTGLATTKPAGVCARESTARIHREARRPNVPLALTEDAELLKNIASNWVLSVVTIIVTYVLMPFTIHRLGETSYGTWMLITSMTGYLLLFTLGVPMASMRYMAQYAAKGQHRELNAAIASTAGMYLALGAISFLVGCGLLFVFDSTYELHIPAVLRGEARLGFFLVVLYISAGFFGQLPYSIMAAHHDFVRRNAIQLAGLFVRLGLTITLLSIAPTLVYLGFIQIAVLVFEFTMMWMIVKRRYPEVRLRLKDFNTKELRLILSFSLFVLILTAGDRMMFQSDALVIGAFLNISEIPYYTVANSLGLYLTEFVIAIAAVVMPTATKLQAQGNQEELKDLFMKWSKITFSLSLMAGIPLLILGPAFLAWWIDPSFERPAGRVLQILMIGTMIFLPARGVALPMLMGLGKPKRPTIAFVISGLVNVGLSILLIRSMGLAGVAIGTSIPLIAFAVAVVVFACRELGISVARYAAYVIPRVCIGAVPAMVVLLAFQLAVEPHGIVSLAAAGFAMLTVYALTLIFFVYRNDPYLDLRSRLPALPRLRRA